MSASPQEPVSNNENLSPPTSKPLDERAQHAAQSFSGSTKPIDHAIASDSPSLAPVLRLRLVRAFTPPSRFGGRQARDPVGNAAQAVAYGDRSPTRPPIGTPPETSFSNTGQEVAPSANPSVSRPSTPARSVSEDGSGAADVQNVSGGAASTPVVSSPAADSTVVLKDASRTLPEGSVASAPMPPVAWKKSQSRIVLDTRTEGSNQRSALRAQTELQTQPAPSVAVLPDNTASGAQSSAADPIRVNESTDAKDTSAKAAETIAPVAGYAAEVVPEVDPIAGNAAVETVVEVAPVAGNAAEAVAEADPIAGDAGSRIGVNSGAAEIASRSEANGPEQCTARGFSVPIPQKVDSFEIRGPATLPDLVIDIDDAT